MSVLHRLQPIEGAKGLDGVLVIQQVHGKVELPLGVARVTIVTALGLSQPLETLSLLFEEGAVRIVQVRSGLGTPRLVANAVDFGCLAV